MAFTKQHISSQEFCILEIGSYKLRLCAAKFKNRKISILKYSEKRQDVSYFSNNECLNIPGLCENIKDALKVFEEEIGKTFKNIIISYPFGEIFISSKHLHYKRKDGKLPLGEKELEEIFESLEKLSLEKQREEIEIHYGLSKKDIQVILSRVNSLKLDGENMKKIVGKSGNVLYVSLINAIIPKK